MSLKKILLTGTLFGIVGLAGCYDSRFDHPDTQILSELDVSAKVANQYDHRFDGDDVISLNKNGFSPDMANQYDYRFDSENIIFLNKRGVSPEVANAYLQAFSRSYVIKFPRSAKLIQSFYEKDISSEDILKLDGKGHSIVDQYSETFNPVELFPLIVSEISPDEANKYADLNDRYGVKISGFDIVQYKEDSFSYEQVAKQARDSWFRGSIER